MRRSELLYGLSPSTCRFSLSPLAYNSFSKASGVRTAEMRWKNQGNLETYGVRLVGWPVDIPMQNPSTLSAAQNTQILNALNEGTMQFLPMGSFGDLPSQAESTHVPDPTGLEETASDMDDYVKYDDLPTSGPSGDGVTETSTLLQVRYSTSTRLCNASSHSVFRTRRLVREVHVEFQDPHPFSYPLNVPLTVRRARSSCQRPRSHCMRWARVCFYLTSIHEYVPLPRTQETGPK